MQITYRNVLLLLLVNYHSHALAEDVKDLILEITGS